MRDKERKKERARTRYGRRANEVSRSFLGVVAHHPPLHLRRCIIVYIPLGLAYSLQSSFPSSPPRPRPRQSGGSIPPFSASERARAQRVSALRAIYFFPTRPPGLSERRADDHGRPGLLF